MKAKDFLPEGVINMSALAAKAKQLLASGMTEQQVVQQLVKEGKITVWENAEHIKRDWTYVGDVCKLHIDFIKTVNGSGIWNCGAGLAHSFLDIAEEIAEIEDVPIEFEPVPVVEQGRMRHKTKADLTNLKATIGKRPWLNVFEFLNQ